MRNRDEFAAIGFVRLSKLNNTFRSVRGCKSPMRWQI